MTNVSAAVRTGPAGHPAILLALLVFAAPPAAQARVHAQWVQLGPEGAATVRAITDDLCPQVVFDGVPASMNVRAEPDVRIENVKQAVFTVRSCELPVPPGTVAATLEGRVLPLPRPNPERILIFGDTGCRIEGDEKLQDCNNPAKWPFPRIAAAAATTRPDLVIHVGDYHYRETPCPADKGCAGSPWGYGFDAWNADFFEPAAPLLAAAPWLMVRGNHEDCVRAGEGWVRFLDARPATTNCRDLTGIFVTRLGEFGLVVVDDARADDTRGDVDALAGVLHKQFAEVVTRVPAEAWLVSHRPLNAMRRIRSGSVVENSVQERAFGSIMPAGVRMSVAGHIHFFQAVDFGGLRPPQLVVGTGGDNLDDAPLSVVGADINGRKVVNSVTYSGFAYMVWDRTGNLWTGTLFGADGKAIDRCRLLDRSLTCGS
jgi:hypothetical protein